MHKNNATLADRPLSEKSDLRPARTAPIKTTPAEVTLNGRFSLFLTVAQSGNSMSPPDATYITLGRCEENTAVAIDWPTVATSVLGSGAVAAAVTPVIAAFREHSKRKADARMVALTAAFVLEKFGSACSEIVSDTLNYDWNDGLVGKVHRQLPPLQLLRTSIDWNLLPLPVASMLLEFEAAAEQANLDLQDELAADHFELAMPIFLRLGERGFEVACQLRKKMKLPQLMPYDAARSLAYLSEQRAAFERQAACQQRPHCNRALQVKWRWRSSPWPWSALS